MTKISDADLSEIMRIAKKKSIQKISKAITRDLDTELLSKLLAAYLVLKADGHPDSDLVKYLIGNEKRKLIPLGFKVAKVVVPSFVTDSEFRSLVLKTRKNMKESKNKKS